MTKLVKFKQPLKIKVIPALETRISYRPKLRRDLEIIEMSKFRDGIDVYVLYTSNEDSFQLHLSDAMMLGYPVPNGKI